MVCRPWVDNGCCTYGATCRFSHPPRNESADAAVPGPRKKDRSPIKRDRSPSPRTVYESLVPKKDRRQLMRTPTSRGQDTRADTRVRSAVVVKAKRADSESDNTPDHDQDESSNDLDQESERLLMKKRLELQRELYRLGPEEGPTDSPSQKEDDGEEEDESESSSRSSSSSDTDTDQSDDSERVRGRGGGGNRKKPVQKGKAINDAEKKTPTKFDVRKKGRASVKTEKYRSPSYDDDEDRHKKRRDRLSPEDSSKRIKRDKYKKRTNSPARGAGTKRARSPVQGKKSKRSAQEVKCYVSPSASPDYKRRKQSYDDYSDDEPPARERDMEPVKAARQGNAAKGRRDDPIRARRDEPMRGRHEEPIRGRQAPRGKQDRGDRSGSGSRDRRPGMSSDRALLNRAKDYRDDDSPSSERAETQNFSRRGLKASGASPKKKAKVDVRNDFSEDSEEDRPRRPANKKSPRVLKQDKIPKKKVRSPGSVLSARSERRGRPLSKNDDNFDRTRVEKWKRRPSASPEGRRSERDLSAGRRDRGVQDKRKRTPDLQSPRKNSAGPSPVKGRNQEAPLRGRSPMRRTPPVRGKRVLQRHGGDDRSPSRTPSLSEKMAREPMDARHMSQDRRSDSRDTRGGRRSRASPALPPARKQSPRGGANDRRPARDDSLNRRSSPRGPNRRLSPARDFDRRSDQWEPERRTPPPDFSRRQSPPREQDRAIRGRSPGRRPSPRDLVRRSPPRRTPPHIRRTPPLNRRTPPPIRRTPPPNRRTPPRDIDRRSPLRRSPSRDRTPPPRDMNRRSPLRRGGRSPPPFLRQLTPPPQWPRDGRPVSDDRRLARDDRTPPPRNERFDDWPRDEPRGRGRGRSGLVFGINNARAAGRDFPKDERFDDGEEDSGPPARGRGRRGERRNRGRDRPERVRQVPTKEEEERKRKRYEEDLAALRRTEDILLAESMMEIIKAEEEFAKQAFLAAAEEKRRSEHEAAMGNKRKRERSLSSNRSLDRRQRDDSSGTQMPEDDAARRTEQYVEDVVRQRGSPSPRIGRLNKRVRRNRQQGGGYNGDGEAALAPPGEDAVVADLHNVDDGFKTTDGDQTLSRASRTTLDQRRSASHSADQLRRSATPNSVSSGRNDVMGASRNNSREGRKLERADGTTDTRAKVGDHMTGSLSACSPALQNRTGSVRSGNDEYDPISDDELDELIGSDKGVSEKDENEQIKSGLVNSLEIDWASLMKASSSPKSCTSSAAPALRRFSAASVLEKVGVSRALAGAAMLCKTLEVARSDPDNTNPDLPAADREHCDSPCTLLGSVSSEANAMNGSNNVFKKPSRVGGACSVGGTRHALSARTDLSMRRRLCRIGKGCEGLVLYPSAMDRDLHKLSLQLLTKSKYHTHNDYSERTTPTRPSQSVGASAENALGSDVTLEDNSATISVKTVTSGTANSATSEPVST